MTELFVELCVFFLKKIQDHQRIETEIQQSIKNCGHTFFASSDFSFHHRVQNKISCDLVPICSLCVFLHHDYDYGDREADFVF